MSDEQRASDVGDELLWWHEADGRYFAWSGGGEPAGGRDVVLVALDGTRRELAALPAEAREVAEALVVTLLSPHARAAVDTLTTTLSGLDPSFAGLDNLNELAGRGSNVDVPATVNRLVERLATTPEALTQALATLIDGIENLRRILSFGRVARPLLESLGLAASTFEPTPPAESSPAMVERVRASVRAELDVQAATRPPLSFDFDFAELARGGRRD